MTSLDTDRAHARPIPAPLPSPLPTDPPTQIQRWAELHVDDRVFRLVAPWRLDQLQAELEAAMVSGEIVRVRVYTDSGGQTVLLVRPSLARVVFLAKRPEFIPTGGMPDPI